MPSVLLALIEMPLTLLPRFRASPGWRLVRVTVAPVSIELSKSVIDTSISPIETPLPGWFSVNVVW
ncbi:hypothetical protein D3C81_1057700 [compost metagenome]